MNLAIARLSMANVSYHSLLAETTVSPPVFLRVHILYSCPMTDAALPIQRQRYRCSRGRRW